jgi:hypothetical protein
MAESEFIAIAEAGLLEEFGPTESRTMDACESEVTALHMGRSDLILDDVEGHLMILAKLPQVVEV